MARSTLLAILALLILTSCRLGETFGSQSLSALLLPKTSAAYAAKFVLRGELHLMLPPGMNPASALNETNSERVQQLVEWQLQYLHGALRHSPALRPAAPVSLSGKREVRLIDAVPGSSLNSAIVRYELRDLLVAHSPIEAAEVSLTLPRDLTGVFAKTVGKNSPTSSCAEGALVPEDHFWFFWDPTPSRCALPAEELVAVMATIEPVSGFGPAQPDYGGLFKKEGAQSKLHVVYMIGDDHAYRSAANGEAAFARAAELLADAGFRERGQRESKRSILYVTKAGGVPVSLELQLVDPASFEFVKASAAALESADVFIYNGQSGFGNYLDWARYERILGRDLVLPRKSQVFIFSGASPFAFETARIFAGKATTLDPEGFGALDVVTTTPGVPAPADGLVGVDVNVLLGLLSPERPTWAELLEKTRSDRDARGVLSYVTGGH